MYIGKSQLMTVVKRTISEDRTLQIPVMISEYRAQNAPGIDVHRMRDSAHESFANAKGRYARSITLLSYAAREDDPYARSVEFYGHAIDVVPFDSNDNKDIEAMIVLKKQLKTPGDVAETHLHMGSLLEDVMMESARIVPEACFRVGMPYCALEATIEDSSRIRMVSNLLKGANYADEGFDIEGKTYQGLSISSELSTLARIPASGIVGINEEGEQRSVLGRVGALYHAGNQLLFAHTNSLMELANYADATGQRMVFQRKEMPIVLPIGANKTRP